MLSINQPFYTTMSIFLFSYIPILAENQGYFGDYFRMRSATWHTYNI